MKKIITCLAIVALLSSCKKTKHTGVTPGNVARVTITVNAPSGGRRLQGAVALGNETIYLNRQFDGFYCFDTIVQTSEIIANYKAVVYTELNVSGNWNTDTLCTVNLKLVYDNAIQSNLTGKSILKLN